MRKRCLYPSPCKKLNPNHKKQLSLLRKLRGLKGIKGVFIGSGVRYDMILADGEGGIAYLENLVEHHVSGQLKIAPEHSVDRVLRRMGKPGADILLKFRDTFNRMTKRRGKKQFLTYYLIAAHPGCEIEDMMQLRKIAKAELHLLPEQVQIFTPTPSTYSTLMYHTGVDPFTGERIFVEKNKLKKERQKSLISENRRKRVKF